VAASIALLFVLAGCTPEQLESFMLVNEARSEAGVRPLEPNFEIGWKAQLWSEQMAKTGVLAHSNLTDGVVSPWTKLGENVGVGPSVKAIHEAFMASESHKENILDPDFQYYGVGVARAANGRLWTAQMFMRI